MNILEKYFLAPKLEIFIPDWTQNLAHFGSIICCNDFFEILCNDRVNKDNYCQYFEKSFGPNWDIFFPNWLKNLLHLALPIHIMDFSEILHDDRGQ